MNSSAIQEAILEDPLRGDVLLGGRGLRKLRAAIADEGRDDLLQSVRDMGRHMRGECVAGVREISIGGEKGRIPVT